MKDEAVAVLRRFNRSFTPRIGVLDESFLGTGRPLAVARLLFEVGLDRDHGGGDGPTVQALRERLDADSGYVSRLLRRLEDDALVELVDDAVDGRRRRVRLTTAGADAWDEVDRRSEEIAVELLDPLTDGQRRRLVSSLTSADRILACAAIATEVVDPAGARAQQALDSYYAELAERFSGGFVAADDSPDERARLAAPEGAFVLLVDGDSDVGCGAVYRMDGSTAEIKRMWLDRSIRGCGMGGRLLRDLERLAAELGCETVVLDTNSSLVEAIEMYLSAGYSETARYNDNPYAQRWFRKAIGPATAASSV